MALEFKIGDLVWAKLKGFPTWPGQVIEPKPEIKRPISDKRKKQFIFFLGSENYAWVPEESMWLYEGNRERFMPSQRVPRGLQSAVDAAEELLKKSSSSSSKKSAHVDKKASTKPDADTAKSQANQKAEKSKVKEDTHKKRKSTSKTDEVPAKAKKSVDDKPKKTSQTQSVKPKRVDAEASGEPRREKSFNLSQSVFSPALSAVKHSSVSASAAAGDTSKTFAPDILQATTSESIWSKRIVATSMKIGFLGLGTMGSAIVSNLLKSGHEVMVWNRTVAKCRDFIRDGAERGNTPSEVVQACDITLSCVSDPTALKDLVFGNSGVLQGIGAGKAYVDMSTVDVETMADVHEAVTARGGRFLEAPLVGNKLAADGGQLIVLAAGDFSLYEDCSSCFKAVGKRSFFLGGVGLATRMKLVVSMLFGTTLAGLSESLALSTKLGLNIGDVLEVLRHSSANSQFVQEKGANIEASKFASGGCKLSLLQKDLKLAINMSDAVDQPLHVSSAVNELYKKAKAKGYGEHDIAAVYRAADL